MRHEDVLYFSPKYKFTDLNFDDKDELLSMFKDRVCGFYLKPARDLCKNKHAFAAGVICSSAIDFLAKIKSHDPTEKTNTKANFIAWLRENAPSLDPEKFYKNFRSGLIHEGKINDLDNFPLTTIPN